ncbi:hypothetical protein QN277_016267 [Acacia crassicarpa]|uniref:Transmembrane protein n=1 Tax=Acacia crassicarpa TaxID=499986 RepID=A0AAE1TBS5_9FABA|nr:hypothetical protein QN277_016267 [Acacia crassicarpa]
MNSITQLHYSSSLLPLNGHHNHHQFVLLMRRTNLPFPAMIRTVQQSPVMRKALPHSSVIIAASSSSAKSLDMSVFLQTSALLLFLYLTANFLVPQLISKYFGFDKVNEEQNINDDDR